MSSPNRRVLTKILENFQNANHENRYHKQHNVYFRLKRSLIYQPVKFKYTSEALLIHSAKT